MPRFKKLFAFVIKKEVLLSIFVIADMLFWMAFFRVNIFNDTTAFEKIRNTIISSATNTQKTTGREDNFTKSMGSDDKQPSTHNSPTTTPPVSPVAAQDPASPAQTIAFQPEYESSYGGNSYYSQWDIFTNSSFVGQPSFGPDITKDDFYPIGVWQIDPITQLNQYTTLGINTLLHVKNIDAANGGPNQAQLNSVKAFNQTQINNNTKVMVFGQPTIAALGGANNLMVKSLFLVDEPDMSRTFAESSYGTCDTMPDHQLAQICNGSSVIKYNNAGYKTWLTPSGMERMYAAIRLRTNNRYPIYENFGMGIVVGSDGFINNDWPTNYTAYEPGATNSSIQLRYLAASDIVSIDYYPVSLGIDSYGRSVQSLGKAVAQIKGMTDNNKPVMAFIEAGCIFSTKPCASPAQTSAEVWSAIINGAGGIGFFDYNFQSNGSNSHNLMTDSSLRTEVTKTIRTVHDLAPVINSRSVTNLITTTKISGRADHVDVMAKMYNGKDYIFLMPSTDDPITVQIGFNNRAAGTAKDIISGTTYEVVNGLISVSLINGNTAAIIEVQ